MSIRPPKADYGRHAQRVAGILRDDELSDYLARYAILLARALDRLDPWPQPANVSTFLERMGDLDRLHRRRDGSRTLRGEIRQDVRRYNPVLDQPHQRFWGPPCGAPMVRRDGACGRRSSLQKTLVSITDGRHHVIGACSRPEHQDWLRTQWAANDAERADRIVPKPYANAGGRLAVHFPEIDWEPIYRWADPRWEPPPERQAPAERPPLQLLTGDAVDEPPPRPVPRPAPAPRGRPGHLRPV